MGADKRAKRKGGGWSTVLWRNVANNRGDLVTHRYLMALFEMFDFYIVIIIRICLRKVNVRVVNL